MDGCFLSNVVRRIQPAGGAFVAAVLVLAAGGLRCSGPEEPPPEGLVGRANPVALTESVLAKARSTYDQSCSECHGRTGRGDGATAGMLRDRPADLSDPSVLSALTDGQIYWVVTRGDKPAMPPFEGKLTEEERWGLVHLLRKMSDTPPNSTPRRGRG